MKRQVEMYEVSFQHHILLFSGQVDAVAAASALSRGSYVSAACNPLNPQARIDLTPIEPKLRRVFVPVSEQACICAFGERMKTASPKRIASALSAETLTGESCRDVFLSAATPA